jgi:hypothetical protein
MYNEDFLKEVLRENGKADAIIFCQIESKKYDKMIKETVAKNPIDAMELTYERDWWANRAKSLKNSR